MEDNNTLIMTIKKYRGGNLLLSGVEQIHLLKLLLPYFNKITVIKAAADVINHDWQNEKSNYKEKIEFIDTADADFNKLPQSAYDFIFLFKELEKLRKEPIKNLIFECRRILKADGKILIAENSNKYKSTAEKTYQEAFNLCSDIEKFFLGKDYRENIKAVSINNYLEYSEFEIIKKVNITIDNIYSDTIKEKIKNEFLNDFQERYLPLLLSDKRAVKKYKSRVEKIIKELHNDNIEHPPFVVFLANNSKETDSSGNKEPSYKVVNNSERLMPREKLMAGMIEEMKLYELIAIIIGMGNKNEDVLTLSKRVIREYGSKSLAGEREPKRLREILSIGEVNACKLVSAFEIGRRFYSTKVKNRRLIRGPEDVFEHAKDMSTLVRENFRGLYLNSKNYVIHDEVISIGHLTASLVHPREVFKAAFEYSAAGIIVIHNHPSGDPEPSENDNKITKMLIEGGKFLGIPILDHIIIGDGRYYSYNDKGKI